MGFPSAHKRAYTGSAQGPAWSSNDCRDSDGSFPTNPICSHSIYLHEWHKFMGKYASPMEHLGKIGILIYADDQVLTMVVECPFLSQGNTSVLRQKRQCEEKRDMKSIQKIWAICFLTSFKKC